MLTILQNQGKVDDAVKICRELLELKKEKLGIVCHEALTTQIKIGEMLYNHCRFSAEDYKNSFEYKAFLYFRKDRSIPVCMIIFWSMLAIICRYVILCFQQY